jgi:hypothetical protein
MPVVGVVQLRVKSKSKDIPVTGHGGPQGCERLRLPHYLDKKFRSVIPLFSMLNIVRRYDHIEEWGEGGEKVKLSLQQAVKVHRAVRGRVSHIFQTIGSHMAVRLSALCAGRPLPPRKIPGTHLC